MLSGVSEIVTLIGAGKSDFDSDGNEILTETELEIFGTVKSVSQREFATAAQIGLKPEFVVEVWESEYNGATKVRVRGKLYDIYRTYTNNERIELYATKRSGINEN